MIFSVPLGEPVYPRSRSIKRAIGLTLVFSSRVFSTSQLHLIACESSLQRSNWLTFFYRVPVDDGNAVSYFFLEGVSFDGWLFFTSFAAFFFNKISSFWTTFGLCEQKRDFDSFIHRSRISKRGRKISTHHPKKRALSSLLFSSLLSSLETQRRRKRCITDTHTNTPRAPC